MTEITTKRIAELRTTVAHLDIDEIGVVNAEGADAEAVLAHFRSVAVQFADPGEEGKCVNCNRSQGGILGVFSWGLVHGEGSCECGWPARAYHFVEMPNGGRLRIVALLQYHPDGVDVR